MVDVAPLQQLTDDVMTADSYVFESPIQFQYTELGDFGPGIGGHQNWSGDNAPYGATIRYRVTSELDDSVRIKITDVQGETLAVLAAPSDPGLHEVVWNYRATGERVIPLRGGQGNDIAFAGFPPGYNARPGEASGEPSTRGNPADVPQQGGGGRRGGGGFGGFGGGGIVGSGQYLVTLEAGRVSAAQVLTVEVLGPVDPRESVIR